MNQELGQVLEELGNARMDSHESHLQLQRKELLEKLRRLFPDRVVRHSVTVTCRTGVLLFIVKGSICI